MDCCFWSRNCEHIQTADQCPRPPSDRTLDPSWRQLPDQTEKEHPGRYCCASPRADREGCGTELDRGRLYLAWRACRLIYLTDNTDVSGTLLAALANPLLGETIWIYQPINC